jgi:hypothetical protein
MRTTWKILNALPLAAALLLLGGCDVSPMGVDPAAEDGRLIWIEDEPELEVWLIRPTSPVDSLGRAAGARADEQGAGATAAAY